MSFPKPVFRLSHDPIIRQLQEHVRHLTPLDSPQIVHTPTADGFRSSLRTRGPSGGGRSIQHDYQVTLRDVDGETHVIVGRGRYVITGSPAVPELSEVDLGVYVSGATVFRVYTYSTDAADGSMGSWQYTTSEPIEDETYLRWELATITDGVMHYHNVGMIRILDVKLCQSCT